jgi:hypothetical protein
MEVPAVTYEYLFCPSSSDLLRPPTQRGAWGLLSGSSTLGTAGHRLWPKILDTTGTLLCQVAGESYTLYRIMPHHSRLKRRGHQPKNKLFLGMIHAFTFPSYDGRWQEGFHHLSARPASLLNSGQGPGLW